MNDTLPTRPDLSDREARLFAQVPANRDRFLAAIAERIPVERMQAVYLFPPIKQGVVETGVAVIAVEPAARLREGHETSEGHEMELGLDVVSEAAVEEEFTDDELADEEFDDVELDADEALAEDEVVDEVSLDADAVADLDDDFVPIDGDIIAPPPPPRPIVITASYRHTLKGADRGKWTVEIIEQADAPLATIEMVVAGVTQRRDEATEPERLDADAVRAAIAAGTWTTPTR